MNGREDNIEDRIIGEVESNTGDDFSVDTGDTGGDGNGDTYSAEPSDTSGRNQGNDDGQRRVDPNARGKRDDKGKGKDKKDNKDGPRRDDKGNIVDEKGNVVAARGVERRLHSQNERLKQYNNTVTQENAQLKQQLQQQQSLNGLPKQFNLSPQDTTEAFRIAGAMKQNPVMGARMALEYALSQGAELNQIIQAEGLQNISLGAQRRMMEEMHRRTNGPIEEQRRTEQAQRHASQQAQRFMVQYPDSEEHWDDIGRMIPEIIKQAEQSGRNIDAYTAGEIALQKLQNFAMANGLDPNRSIQSQIDEKRAQQSQGQQRQPNPQRRDVRQTPPRPQAPMPNGSRGGNQVQGRSGSLPATASSDAIVRQAMMDNGYNFGN